MPLFQRVRARFAEREALEVRATRVLGSIFTDDRLAAAQRAIARRAAPPQSVYLPRVVDDLRDEPLRRGTDWFEPPETYFGGLWADKHPLNVPGPFYGAMTDTCCDGPPLAPASLLYDSAGQGFVWRQPRNEGETLALMTGASSDPFGGYACDGDRHWTPDSVREWWSGRADQRPAIDLIVSAVAGERPKARSDKEDLLFRCLPIGGYSEEARVEMRGIVREYLAYRAQSMEQDLRRYVFLLETGSPAVAGDALPQL